MCEIFVGTRWHFNFSLERVKSDVNLGVISHDALETTRDSWCTDRDKHLQMNRPDENETRSVQPRASFVTVEVTNAFSKGKSFSVC